MSVGGATMKPDNRKIPLDPGVHAVTLDDVVSGVSDNTGKQYWILKLSTQGDFSVQFDHFIQCEETEFKSMDKVFKAAAEQMEALFLYDKIGEQPNFESWFNQAIDLTYALKGKTIEFTVKEYNFDGKSGNWGRITGFLDTPNEAVQAVPKSAEPTFDHNEELGF